MQYPNPAKYPHIVVHDGLDLIEAERDTHMRWNGEHYVNDDILLAFHPDQIYDWSGASSTVTA